MKIRKRDKKFVSLQTTCIDRNLTLVRNRRGRGRGEMYDGREEKGRNKSDRSLALNIHMPKQQKQILSMT